MTKGVKMDGEVIISSIFEIFKMTTSFVVIVLCAISGLSKPSIRAFSCFTLQRHEMLISCLVDYTKLSISTEKCGARGRLPLFKAMCKWADKWLREALYEIQDFEISIGRLSGEIPVSD